MHSLSQQILYLFLLAIPVACISWTVTHEEIFREPREFCINQSKSCQKIYKRKFFYLFTCEYCFSHYVTIILLLITGYKLLFNDWRGYLVSGLSLVWIANVYMSIFAFLRYGLKNQRIDASIKEVELTEVKENTEKV